MECSVLYRCELCEKEALCGLNKKAHDDWLKNIRVSNIRKSVIVTGPRGGSGSTLFSVLLAEEMSARGFRVGIIESNILNPVLPYYMGFDFESIGLELTDAGIKVPVYNQCVPYLSPLLFMYDEPKLLAWDEDSVMRFMEGMIVNPEWGNIDLMIFDMPFYQVNLISTMQQFMSGRLNSTILVADPKNISGTLIKSQLDYLGELSNVLGVVFSPSNNSFDIKGKYGDYKAFNLPFVVSVNAPEVRAGDIPGMLRQPYSDVIKEVSQSCLSIFSN